MAAVSRITATPVTEMGPLFWLWPASRPHAASKKGSHQHGPWSNRRPKPRSATGPSRLESPAKRPRIGVWTRFNMDKGPLPPSSISRNPVSYSAARTFHFFKNLHPTPFLVSLFSTPAPFISIWGSGWQRLGPGLPTPTEWARGQPSLGGRESTVRATVHITPETFARSDRCCR
jgi:hypothetical protein